MSNNKIDILYFLNDINPPEYLLSRAIIVGVIIDAMKKITKINIPILGFLDNGYNINGDIQNNCMSTAKYQVWPKHP